MSISKGGKMAEKKKTSSSSQRKKKVSAELAERITDFSTNSLKDVHFVPKKKK